MKELPHKAYLAGVKKSQMTIKKVLACCVSQSNTPETDAMAFVLHDVKVQYANGEIKILKLKARDPLDAIEKVNKQVNV